MRSTVQAVPVFDVPREGTLLPKGGITASYDALELLCAVPAAAGRPFQWQFRKLVNSMRLEVEFLHGRQWLGQRRRVC
jgi:hypothetical protein